MKKTLKYNGKKSSHNYEEKTLRNMQYAIGAGLISVNHRSNQESPREIKFAPSNLTFCSVFWLSTFTYLGLGFYLLTPFSSRLLATSLPLHPLRLDHLGHY